LVSLLFRSAYDLRDVAASTILNEVCQCYAQIMGFSRNDVEYNFEASTWHIATYMTKRDIINGTHINVVT